MECYGMMNQRVSDNRHSMVEKSGKKMKHINMVKNDKNGKNALNRIPKIPKQVRDPFWHFQRGFRFSPNVKATRKIVSQGIVV
jgi:hypothetical protein